MCELGKNSYFVIPVPRGACLTENLLGLSLQSLSEILASLKSERPFPLYTEFFLQLSKRKPAALHSRGLGSRLSNSLLQPTINLQHFIKHRNGIYSEGKSASDVCRYVCIYIHIMCMYVSTYIHLIYKYVYICAYVSLFMFFNILILWKASNRLY